MNESDAQKTLIGLWLEKAEESLASAELELNADHTNFAVNRLYYACFYAVTALLLQDGKQFARHSAIRSEFNRTYIKLGTIDAIYGNAVYWKLREGLIYVFKINSSGQVYPEIVPDI